MARTISLHVQVDRLPDTPTHRQVGVRVSAAIRPDGIDRATEADRAHLIPWRWSDGAGSFWDPDAPEAWKVFAVEGGKASSLADAAPVRLQRLDSGDRLWAATERRVDDIGEPSRFEVPQGEVAGTTLFGFVEGLTALPAPYPATFKVWSCLNLPHSTGDDRREILALPVFGPAGEAYRLEPAIADGDALTPGRDANGTIIPGAWDIPYRSMAAAGTHPDAAAQVRSARPPEKASAQILDTAAFTIARGRGDGQEDWTAAADEDWMAALPDRFAEALDPTPRLLSALDAIIHRAVSADPTSPEAAPLEVLRDRSCRALLLRLIDTVAWRVMAPATASAPLVAAPASLLPLIPQAGTPNDPGVAAAAATMHAVLVALSDREGALMVGDGRPDAPAPDTFRLRSRGALAALVGASADEIDEGGKQDKASNTRPVDTEDAFRAWLLARWLSEPEGRSQRPLPEMTDRWIAVDREVEWTPDAANRFAMRLRPQLDLAHLPDVTSIRVRMVLADAAIPSTLAVAVRVPGSPEVAAQPLAEITVSIVVNADGLSLGGRDPRPVDAARPVDVILTLVPDGTETLLVLGAEQGGRAIDHAPREDAPRIRSERSTIRVRATQGAFADVSVPLPGEIEDTLRPYLDKGVTTGALRLAIARAFAGPYLPHVVSGADSGMADADPRDRVVKSFAALVGPLYDDLRDRAIAALGGEGMVPDPVVDLFGKLVLRAAADAMSRAGSIVPITRAGGRITPRAAPIVLPIDQVQPFAVGDDLWGRFAGVGALIGRANRLDAALPDGSDASRSRWWSLNAADLHVPAAPGGRRERLDAGNWARRVDPVPMQVAEVGGVRAASLVYDSRSLVGEMPADVSHSEDAVLQAYRRPEAYAFPRALQVGDRSLPGGALPPLSFGKAFFVLPYLIGHGGTLPIVLRRDPLDPVRPRWVGTGESFEIEHDALDAETRDTIRQVACLRTAAIGAPRLDAKASTSLGVPGEVTPLAGELPIRPALVTLPADEEARFYMDLEALKGTLEFASSDPARRALQVDLGGVGLAAGVRLTLRIVGSVAENAFLLTPLCEISIDNSDWPLGTAGLRIAVGPHGIGIFREAARTDLMADEPSSYDLVRGLPAESLDRWGTFAVALQASAEIDVVPPTVAFGSRQGGPDAPASPPRAEDLVILDAFPQLAPEVAHRKRTVAVLDGIGPGNLPTAKLRLRRPATDFGTYAQWINWALSHEIRGRLDAEHGHQTRVRSSGDQVDMTIDDPAVVALAFELVEIFPGATVHPVTILGGSNRETVTDIIASRGNGTDVEIKVVKRGAATVTPNAVTVVAGCIYELRIYGAVPEEQPAIAPGRRSADRIAAPVRHALRKVVVGTTGYRLGAPLSLTLEIATDEMPDVERVGHNLIAIHARRGMEELTDDAAFVRLNWQALGPTDAEAYRLFRYVNRVGLFSQLWTWRGRPHPQRALITSCGNVDEDTTRLLFSGRRDDDIGIVLKAELGRIHLSREPLPTRSPLIEKNLGYRGGANLWRFGLRFTSRYAAMRPEASGLTRFSHRAPSRARADWALLPLLDRPTGRVPTRPPLSLVLPLTEPFMSETAVPPLLAIFAEGMFANAHIGDGIDAVIDYVRHPIPEEYGGPAQRYWPQIGPDPVLSARGHDGSPVPLRIDGPLGYTYDLEAEAPRFNHSGCVVSVVSPERPAPDWMMAKLRFRRLEDPELLEAEPVAGDASSIYPVASRPAPPGRPPWRALGTVHEGLALDVDAPPDEGGLVLRVGPLPTVEASASQLAVDWARTDDRLSVRLGPTLGGSGTWIAPLSEGSSFRFRLVVSPRERPSDGLTRIKPILDLALRVLIQREGEGLVREHENTWITIACLPLSGVVEVAPLDAVGIQFEPRPKTDVKVRPVRLSAFSPAVWCQFAQQFSRVRVVIDGTDEVREVRCEDIAVTIGPGWRPRYRLDGPGPASAPLKEILPLVPTAAGAQVAFGLAAVVTRYVHDAFDRLRELPMRVFDASVGADPVWTNLDDRTDPASANEGRIRFLTLQRLQNVTVKEADDRLVRVKPAVFPDDFFNEVLGEDIERDPLDAKGRVVGTSKPIYWTYAP
ncbi:hypothetical protein [Methylobacterium planeticum]|uniref:Uncharacterized protein n=1 Tax=Methylobacterium planeticum TaxID=2615211 RepID=A0A6N6MKJ1_9HYPH|nr:hypothetical protein [Methylobacterium planeticum]KAB1070165.1 hypothetical protein F6X51_23645 [Methylobacterium planeticum]